MNIDIKNYELSDSTKKIISKGVGMSFDKIVNSPVAKIHKVIERNIGRKLGVMEPGDERFSSITLDVLIYMGRMVSMEEVLYRLTKIRPVKIKLEKIKTKKLKS